MKEFVLIHKDTRAVTKCSAFSEEQAKFNLAFPENYEVREFNLKL